MNNEDMYKNKYLKYKTKYLELKNKYSCVNPNTSNLTDMCVKDKRGHYTNPFECIDHCLEKRKPIQIEFVFFKCKELDQQPERIKRLLLEGEDIFDKSDVYWGLGKNDERYRLDPNNIKKDNSSLSLIDPNRPLISNIWNRLKQTNRLKRDTRQNENLLKSLGIMPFKEIEKYTSPSGELLWSHYQTTETKNCDYFALMIDPAKNALAGVAKAYINRPGSDTYEAPLDSEILPNTVDYIYISAVDIHPNYIGKGYCKPLVTFLMNKISEILPSHKYFSIDNASINDEGIPACVCYVKSGTKNGYDVYYGEYESDIVNKMRPELCYISDKNTKFKMPDMYYYVKK